MYSRGKEKTWKFFVMLCGLLMIALPIAIGVFLAVKGNALFFQYHHSLWEFLFTTTWKLKDNLTGGGQAGAAVFIVGSLIVCGLALLIAVPFSLAAAIFMTEIAPKAGNRILRPAVEIFVGIPSVVYGWIGMTVLVPAIQQLFHLKTGRSVLAGGIVLAIMVFPSITTVAADAIRAVPVSARMAAYGLGATRWQVIHQIVLPAAKTSVLTGVILGLARAFGEALAVALVIGKTPAFPKGIFGQTATMTTVIASRMAELMEGSEAKAGLWTIAFVLYLISLLFIFLIHLIAAKGAKKES